jgi:hypothetical protein
VVDLYRRGPGGVRAPDQERRKEGPRRYKKGWEVRFAVTAEAIDEASGLLERAGLKSGAPFRKSRRQWIVPVYGRGNVQRFLTWAEEAGGPARSVRPRL